MAKRKKPDLGAEIIAGLKEAIAHRRGEIVLEGRVVKPMRAGRGEEAFPAAATLKALKTGS